MSAQNFIEYYKKIAKSEIIFHFKRFIQIYCCECVIKPVKAETRFEFDFSKAKDLLMANLCLNESFYEHDYYFTEDFDNLYKIMIEENFNRTYQAQIILLILISKANLQFNFFENYLLEIKFLHLIDNPNQFDNLIELFKKLKSNQIVRQKVLNISQKIININDINFNFDMLDILFFKFPDHDLHGFAGINGIYVAFNPLAELKKKLENKRDKKDANLILSLEFTRLFIHLVIHVVLIWTKNDMNFPNNRSDDYNKFWSVDSGHLIEENFFKAKINWFKFEEIDLGIWRIFYDQLMVGEFVNFEAFNTGVQKKKYYESINGIDYFSFKD